MFGVYSESSGHTAVGKAASSHTSCHVAASCVLLTQLLSLSLLPPVANLRQAAAESAGWWGGDGEGDLCPDAGQMSRISTKSGIGVFDRSTLFLI